MTLNGHNGNNSNNGAHSPPGAVKRVPTDDYYRRLRARVQAGILSAILLPLSLLFVYFHFQFNSTLKETGKQHLILLAESQRNTVDLFLQERVINILNLFQSEGFSLAPERDQMWRYLQNLKQLSDTFIDVGFIDPDGTQVGYAGPYLSLQWRDYSNEDWYRELIGQDESYFISDVYMGLRDKPHFTIGVKQIFEGRPYVMRATLDPDEFYQFIRTIGEETGVDSMILNRAGQYQVAPPDFGEPFEICEFMPSADQDQGACELERNREPVLTAHAWLSEAPWVLVVSQPLKTAYAHMYRVRVMLALGTLIIVIILTTVTLITTSRLLHRAQETEEARKELKTQLYHASKLVAIGELAAGIAHEINNPLAIISSQSGVVRDMFDPEFDLHPTPDDIRTELDEIDKAVFRARDITKKLLDLSRKYEPKFEEANLNDLIEDVVGGLIEKEMKVSNIKLVRKYDKDLPLVTVERDQLRQVFLNLVNNAVDAIDGPGQIKLETSHDEGWVRATVTDSGSGMTTEQIEKIFLPFFTTKETGKGTGLGLSISLNIVDAMGGRIDVQSMPGAGSSFSVVLPVTPDTGAEAKDGGRQD